METKSIFQSKTFWGAVVSGVSAMALIFGVSIESVEQTTLLTAFESVGAAIDTVLTIWGRFTAKKKVT